MRRAAGGLLRAAAVSLVAVAMGPVANVLASPPDVTIQSPDNGSVSNEQTPFFSGGTDDPLDEVTLKIYAGPDIEEGSLRQTLTAPLPLTGTWSVGPAETLADGVYTAQASQTNLALEEGVSEPPVTFRVDTSSPTVSLNQPPSPSGNTQPSFTGTASDTNVVTVRIFDAVDSEVSSATASGTGGDWSSGKAGPALPSGTYTAIASQESSLGNPTGTSNVVTFTVDTSSPTVTLDQPPSPSNTTRPSFTGTASDTTPVTVEIYAGATATGSIVSTAKATGTGGGWTSGDASPGLPDGQYTATATQASSLGNGPGTSSAVGFTVDTASPTVTLNQPASPSNDTTPFFTGFASDTTPVTVQIYAGATAKGSLVSTANATDTGGGWTSGTAGPPLADGQYTAIATQASSLGNPAGVSEPVTFSVQTSAPRVTLNQPKSPSNNSTPTFTGNASDTTAVVVQIYTGASAGGPVVSTAAATGTGAGWSSGHADPGLQSGTYTAVASQESSLLGNPAGTSAPVTFVVDTSSPTVTLNQPKSPSNNATPSFVGTATATTAVTVQVYAGTTATGTVVSTAKAAGTGGAWGSGNASPALSSGQYTAIATQESPLGNPAGISASVTFTVETAAPRVTLKSPQVRSNNTTPSFTGTASDPTEPVTVQIYSGATAKGSVVSTAKATGTGGAWSSPNASPALPNGQYTATATQASSLGNAPGTSAPVTFTVDTTAPTVTLNQPKSPSNNTKPLFTGNASDTTAVTVQIYAGTTAKGTPVSAANEATRTGGSWTSTSASPALPNGQYTATAMQASSLGNEPGISAPVTFTVDTTSPTVTLAQPKSPSNDITPSFTGTASDTTAVVVRVYDEAEHEVASAEATPSGTKGEWTSGKLISALSSGSHTYTATATQTSPLGNPAGVSPRVTFTVDTTSPTVTLAQPKSPSNDITPSFTGTASDTTAVVVKVYDEGEHEVASAEATPSGAKGEWTSGNLSSALSSGSHTYTATATQTSPLGNPAGVSPRVTFTVDTTPPTVTLQAPPSPSNDTTPSFTGTASDTTPVLVQVYAGSAAKGTVIATAKEASRTGNAWTSVPANLVRSGKHTYTAIASQESSLGNPTGTSVSVTFVVDPEAPTVTLNPPRSPSNSSTPSFTGTASDTTPVMVKIHPGPTPSGPVVATAVASGTGGGWVSANATPALEDGQYTAVASQDSVVAGHEGTSSSYAFTIDTAPPHVTLSYPADGSSTGSASQLVQGSASAGSGDLTGVTVQLFSGSEIANGQVPVQSIQVVAVNEAWSVTVAGLNPGTYTVRAEQSDDAGNVGISSPTTFAVRESTPAAPTGLPSASFSWTPTTPHAGEKVLLLSSSTDLVSPIVGFAWDLAGNGGFAAGGAANSTSFSTPGAHLVQLRVTDANGASSVAAETIKVGAAALPLMQPFPTVRITATRTGSGIRLKLLSVRASAGARIAVKCTGRGCPVKALSRVAAAGKAGTAPVELRRLERFLPAGVVLEVRVSKAGVIGKYTRFAIRRRKLPVRTDACLGPAAGNPIACPTS